MILKMLDLHHIRPTRQQSTAGRFVFWIVVQVEARAFCSCIIKIVLDTPNLCIDLN